MTRSAVVTGGSKGFGRGLAQALALRGYRVVIAATHGEESAQVAAAIGGGALGYACDIRDHAQVQALWDHAVAQLGSIDLWINNAGLALTDSPLAAVSTEDFRRMIDVNLIGTLHGCQVALAGMRASGGAIYNVLGAGSDGVVVPRMGGYATGKCAVAFLTRSLVEETRGLPVLIGAINPGLVMSEGFLREHARFPAEQRAAREAWINLIGDHVGTVADWAAAIMATSRDHGAVFQWLTPEKIALRRVQEPDRDILSAYR